MKAAPSNNSKTNQFTPYHLFTLVLSVAALIMLGMQLCVSENSSEAIILHYADTGVCVLFMLDFIVTLIHSDDKRKYLLSWGWIDFISSIPVGVFRIGRIARILRILRLLRAVRASKTLADHLLARRSEGTFLVAALLSLLLIVFSSIAILNFEHGEKVNIQTAEEAIWWSFVTMTTVGYGDKYPVTTEGRMVAVVLMVTGVGLFGIISGFIASWFISPRENSQNVELQQLQKELEEIKELIKQIDSN